jgi:glutathione S-transferase
MKLYFSPGACSLSPHIVLIEAGLDFTSERVDLREKKTAGGEDYGAINPKGYVPALALDGGGLLTEGPAIVQYLADLAPAAGLLPPVGDVARYKVVAWLGYISSELHKNFSPLFNPAATEDMKAHAHKMLAMRLEHVAAQLDGRSWKRASAWPTPTCSRCSAGPIAWASAWPPGRCWANTAPASPRARPCSRRCAQKA